MKIRDIIKQLEGFAPLQTAESFDNVGLLVGSEDAQCKGVLVAHDCLEGVVEEAVSKGANLIVSFHPIIFSGLKSLTGKTYVERSVMKAIKNDVAIYALHTALDNSKKGVSYGMCEALGLKNAKTLVPQESSMLKLTVFCPLSHADKLRFALAGAGAGKAGFYGSCSFSHEGTGRFMAEEGSKPYVGKHGEVHSEAEEAIGVIFPKYLKNTVLNALLKNHPYESPVFEIFRLETPNPDSGLGMTGEFETAMNEKTFLELLKKTFQAEGIRYSKFTGKKIKKVAVLGGSGAAEICRAMASGADAYVSADFKYHDFFLAEDKILLVDVGHYESEMYTKNLIAAFLKEKFSTFAIRISETKTNPINYLK